MVVPPLATAPVHLHPPSASLSTCGNYSKYLNTKGILYLTDPRAVEILNTDKESKYVYKTLQEFESKVVEKISGLSSVGCSVKYRTNITSKYVHIKCQTCSVFSYWYCNSAKKDVSQIAQGEPLDLVFFRSIN